VSEQSALLTRIAATNQRFIMRADERLTVFAELELAIRAAQDVRLKS
jgi:hypothetical protein